SQSVDGIFYSIEVVGRITNREEQAGAIVNDLRKRLKAIKGRVEGEKRPKVFFIVGTEPLITAGRSAFITDLINIAGGESISADVSSDWPAYSVKTSISRATEIILMP